LEIHGVPERAYSSTEETLYIDNFQSREKAATHRVRAGAMISHVRPQSDDGMELQKNLLAVISAFENGKNWHQK